MRAVTVDIIFFIGNNPVATAVLKSFIAYDLSSIDTMCTIMQKTIGAERYSYQIS